MGARLPIYFFGIGALALACASEPLSVGARPGPDSGMEQAGFSSGKLIELNLYDVLGDRAIVDSQAGLRSYEQTSLPSQYTVLAAMPDSGPLDATYSMAFDVNGKRVSVTNFEPFYLTSAMPGHPSAWNVGPGTFEIKASAHLGKDGQGEVAGIRAMTFEILGPSP